MSKFKTLEYIISNKNKLFPIIDLAKDFNDSSYNYLLHDLDLLDDLEVQLYAEDKQLHYLINEDEDYELMIKAYYLEYLLEQEMLNKRVTKLELKFIDRFSSKNFENVWYDENNLCKISDLQFYPSHFLYGNYVYELFPVLKQSNSSNWIRQKIFEIWIKEKLIFKVQLDPLVEIKSDKYIPYHLKSTVYSKPVDWEYLFNLKNIEHGQFINDYNSNYLGQITEYTWVPSDLEITFTCEEVPTEKFEVNNIARYFHAIINKETKLIIHCDGAIRLYDSESLSFRRSYHLKNSEVTKVGQRFKIFQFDSYDNSGKGLSLNYFTSLVNSFFYWNDDVFKYMSQL